MATIVDVARRAGVATSTVSHVLNGTRFVSPGTAEAVRAAVAVVGYTPNVLARALARSTTNTVGLALSSTTNRYFADVINAIEAECAAAGLLVLLANTHDEKGRELQIVAELHQRRVDGIILAPCCDPAGHALDYLRDKNVPTVLVDRLPEAGFDGVGVENVEAVGEMVAHLAGMGHRRIGLLGGQASFTTAVERARGFRAALERNRLPVDEDLISIGHTDLEMARAAAAGMLTGPAPVDAFVGGNNLNTIGVLMAIRDRGLAVPRDIAIVGFDDFEWVDAFEPRITAMVQPCQEIGRTAAAMLKARMSGAGEPPRTVRLPPRFVVRDSCGAFGGLAAVTGSDA